MPIFKRKNNFVLSGGKKERRWKIIVIFAVVLASLFFVFPSLWNKPVDRLNERTGFSWLPHFPSRPFRLGLDLKGGTHLVYEADLSNIKSENYDSAMQGVRDVIERRVNIFGVAEPVVQVNKTTEQYRLIIELAGVKDVRQAIKMIGQTPSLVFCQEREESVREDLLKKQEELKRKIEAQEEIAEDETEALLEDPYFKPTSLTGQYLEEAQLQFDNQTYQPQVGLQFDEEGSDLFERITEENVGKRIAIYLDGAPISAPVVQEPIGGGQAQITGNFSLAEAKELVQRLNAGALPVPINLINQQTIGASLGQASLDRSLEAGVLGFLAILLFIIFYYRLPGLLASLALLIYVILVLAIFKLVPVTLTLAGIAGFILSIGMAVDANILIFERLKEELKSGKSLGGSIEEGFNRAWPAIRDSNVSTIITSLILYIFTSGLVRGFALTLGIGVLASMLSAVFITRTFLRTAAGSRLEGKTKLWK